MADVIRGRVWKFGDDINTDLMLPALALLRPEAEQRQFCFSANRPGWVDQVRPGDIIVGGRNYGTGSSRPAARVLREVGIACLLADSINGLFLRNCVNFGLPAMACAGVSGAFEEGEVAEVDMGRGTVVNVSRGARLDAAPLPQMLLDIIDAGGIIPRLRAQGYL